MLLMAIMGLSLLLAGLHQAPYFASCRILVSRLVLPMMTCSWRVVPVRATALVVKGYQAYVHYWFCHSENNFLVSSMFIIIVLIGIPAGAIFNAARGGSPFLLILLAGLALIFVTLAILSETGRFKGLAALLSTFLFLALFVFVPGYVFHSLTDRLLNLTVGRAVFGSFLIVPLLYLAAQSSVLVISQLIPGRSTEGVGQMKPYLIAVIAGLPLAYFLTFATFLAHQSSDVQTLVPMTWQPVIVGVVVLSVSISITLHCVSWGNRQHSVLMRGLVTLFIIAVPAGLVTVVIIAGGSGTSTAHSVYLGDLSEPHLGLVLWILLLAFLPAMVIFVFQAILIFARTMSYVFPENDRVGNQGTSRACVFIGSSSLLIGGLFSLLAVLI